jgi:hypothetical protein
MPPRASAEAQQPAAGGAERVVGIRKQGPGQQYEIKWHGVAETTWEAASRVRKQVPALVQAFEAEQQQQRQEGAPDTDAAMAADAADAAAPVEAPDAGSMTPAAMMQQMLAMQQIMQQQQLQLQQLRASPAHSPQLSPQQSPQQSPSRPLAPGAAAPAAAAQQSRFARKEPRAQDLREYDGASGAKLDEWLQELALATDLFELNAREASKFAASRLRGAALQWWLSMSASERAATADTDSLSKALRARFQPVTAGRVAREQLTTLQQGSRHVNDYIAEFQRLHTLLPAMAEEDALFQFERGLRRELAEKLRVQGVSTLREAIAMAARVGGLTQPAPSAAPGRFHANQMDVDDGNGAPLGARIDQLQATLHAMQAQQARGGITGQMQRGRSGAGRGGRGVFGSGRGGFMRPTPTIPGVPAAVVEQRRAAGQCYRCGSSDHQGRECPNATSAVQHGQGN